MHNAGLDHPIHPGDGRKGLLLLWLLIPILTAGGALETGADLVSTSVLGDGSVMSSSTWLSDGSLITGRIFGSGLTGIDRETETDRYRSDTLNARTGGSLLIWDYAYAEQETTDQPLTCVFGNSTTRQALSEIGRSGILRKGNYSRVQTLQPVESLVTADGTGMLDLRHRLSGNGTLSGRTLAVGNLSVSEHIRADQGTSP